MARKTAPGSAQRGRPRTTVAAPAVNGPADGAGDNSPTARKTKAGKQRVQKTSNVQREYARATNTQSAVSNSKQRAIQPPKAAAAATSRAPWP
jgi:hypothetical protein